MTTNHQINYIIMKKGNSRFMYISILLLQINPKIGLKKNRLILLVY